MNARRIDTVHAHHLADDVHLVDQDGARVTIHLPMAAPTAAAVILSLAKRGFDFDPAYNDRASATGHVTGDRPTPGETVGLGA